MKKRILLVDDEAEVTSAMKRNLVATGRFEVMEINNPELAIKNAHMFKPDLVILDVMMPEMDGGVLAAAITDDPHLTDVPVVFLTGIVSKHEVEPSGSRIGNRTFLAKPIKFDDLLICINEQLTSAD
jgi:CheY-like chemotaxis protein